MADNNDFKSKGYHSKSEMRRLEAQKSEFEKARDEFAGNTEKHIKMYGTSTLVQRSRDLRVEGADWAREFVLDSPEVRGLKEALERICALDQKIDADNDCPMCGFDGFTTSMLAHQALSAFEAAKGTGDE